MFLRRRQEDQATKVSNIFGVIWKVRIQFKVKVNVHILCANDAKTVCVFLLIKDKQAGTVLLPICAIDVDEHLDAINEENYAFIFLKATL